MIHQRDLANQVKRVISAKYYNSNPDIQEFEPKGVLVSTKLSIGTDEGDHLLRITMEFHCMEDGILIRSILEAKASTESLHRVADLIAGINTPKRISCLEMDFSDGEIAGRNYLHCKDYVPSVEMIYTLANDINQMLMKHGHLLVQAMDTDEIEDDTIDTSNAPDLLEEALKGNKQCEALLLGLVKDSPESEIAIRLKKAANEGNKQAKRLYYMSRGARTDFEGALLAADEGDIEAQYYLGQCYQNGDDGAPIDREKSTYWLKKAAEAGSADAYCYLGTRIFVKGEAYGSVEEGLVYMEKAAQYGNATAQFLLGDFYWDGNHVAQNRNHAITLYERSANQNYADAVFKLGLIYHFDKFGYADPRKAAYWFERAAEQGNVAAQKQTASNYLTGNGVEEDVDKFRYWLEKAALQGDDKSIGLLRQYFAGSPVLAQIDRASSSEASTSSQTTTTTDNGGCYIATCVYGSYDCPQVWTLRRFRDLYLKHRGWGRAFIRLYYAVSPKLVKYFGGFSLIRRLWQKPLDALVKRLQREGMSDSEYSDQ